MDIGRIRELAFLVRRELILQDIVVDMIILFGSQAKKTARSDSDIDLAIVSKHFGIDRIAEGALVNRAAYQTGAPIEAIPIGLQDFFERENPSPILAEIRKTGIILF